MSEEIITFNSSTALNGYLVQRGIEQIKEGFGQIWEDIESGHIDDANIALRECERNYSRSKGKVAISSEWDDRGNLHYNYLQTNSLSEFKNYMLVDKKNSYSYVSDKSYFAIFNSSEISRGYPSDDMFRYANEDRIHWIPTSKISDYGQRIILFGDNLRFLYKRQAEALTDFQLQAIIDAKIKLPKDSWIYKRIQEYKKSERNQKIPTLDEAQSKCCIIE